MLLPGLPAQDRRTSAGAAAGRIFFGQERAAEDRRDAEQRKQVGRGYRAAQQLRFAIAGQRQVEVVVGGEAIERSALLAQVIEVAKRKLRERGAVLRGLLADRHDAIRGVERQRLEQHGVDDAEDRCVRADAEREREHTDGAVGAFLPQHACAVQDVSPEAFEEHAHRCCGRSVFRRRG